MADLPGRRFLEVDQLDQILLHIVNSRRALHAADRALDHAATTIRAIYDDPLLDRPCPTADPLPPISLNDWYFDRRDVLRPRVFLDVRSGDQRRRDREELLQGLAAARQQPGQLPMWQAAIWDSLPDAEKEELLESARARAEAQQARPAFKAPPPEPQPQVKQPPAAKPAGPPPPFKARPPPPPSFVPPTALGPQVPKRPPPATAPTSCGPAGGAKPARRLATGNA
jgi:nucleotide-binding universal stress UspA family protein